MASYRWARGYYTIKIKIVDDRPRIKHLLFKSYFRDF